jgi:nucleoside-diphosphate-sugar epimerase
MEPRRGDLADAHFVNQSIQDVDAVIHTAAVAGVWGPWDHFYRNNVLATHHVIAACRAHRVGNLVFTSSPSVTFRGDHQRGVDESEPYPERWLCHYPHTKALAEQHVITAHAPGQLATLALRPHLIWGETDPHILPRLVQRAASGRLRIVGDGQNRVDTVHVVNAAAAHLDALDALHREPESAGGRAYFIAQDEPVNCWEWISQICEIAQVPPPRKRISFPAAYALGTACELAYRALGKKSEPPMTRFVAAQLARDHYFDISEARRRLRYQVRLSMASGLQRLREAWSAGGSS